MSVSTTTAVAAADPLLARKRKMLLLLPVFIIPFLALFFWAFGGGKGQEEAPARPGLNTDIPTTANTQILSKDEAYRRAQADSEQRARRAAEENYVYGEGSGLAAPLSGDPYAAALAVPPGSTPAQAALSGTGDVGWRVDASLADLQRQAATPAVPEGSGSDGIDQYLAEQQRFTQSMLASDPVYQSLLRQSLGDKQPDTDNVRAVAIQETFIPVEATGEQFNPVSRLSNSDSARPRSRFFSGTAGSAGRRAGVNTIGGVIHQDQTVQEGTVVKIRLTADINLAGLLIPRNTFVYAAADLGAERLNLTVTTIAYGGSIYPVKLQVYDVDGLPGIRIPGATDQETRAAAASQVIGGGNVTTGLGTGGVVVNSNPNFGSQVAAQVTGSVLESGKQLLSRKMARQKVFLKANYKLYLKQSASL